MSELVFLLEEPSAQAMLEGLLPRLLPADTNVRYIVFEGKHDLEKQLVQRLRGYLAPHAKFVVLRDQDSSDCRNVKNGLLDKCRKAGRDRAIVRVACHELESWYLADLTAVERGLGISGLAANQKKAKFRTPDQLPKPSEDLRKLTKDRYQKVGGSHAIGPHLDVDNTRSRSFAVFVAGIRRLITDD